jgi:hypothetical protein
MYDMRLGDVILYITVLLLIPLVTLDKTSIKDSHILIAILPYSVPKVYDV